MTQRTLGGPSARGRVGLVLGGVLFLLMLILPAPAGLGAAAWRVAAAGVLMATWWVTEAIPIPATALLPLALFPVLGIMNAKEELKAVEKAMTILRGIRESGIDSDILENDLMRIQIKYSERYMDLIPQTKRKVTRKASS